jgi:NAD(P)-dependent dehydrogenase (short-subunit alcohol dehydrogenase family)
MSAKKLSNKLAVVTGAASGIGRAVAIRLSKEGASVVVSDLNEDKGNETVKIITDAGNKATFIRSDCSDEESIKNLMKEANIWGGNKGIVLKLLTKHLFKINIMGAFI